MRKSQKIIGCLAFAFAVTFGSGSAPAQVEIKKVEGKDQYDVSVGGKLFTSYCYDDKEFFEKPVFWPVLTLSGAPVNRSFPMIKGVAGEPTDHPHHQSLWFTYGNVNGLDFWDLDTKKTGRRIKQTEVKAEKGTIEAILNWNDPQGTTLLEERKKVGFGGATDVRWMDHDLTLTAKKAVKFGDTKEGAFGIRVAKSLQELGGSGHYLNAEGLTSREVWGKPSAWVALEGTLKSEKGDEDVSIVIFSHPSTLNHPPYWHARDYGLFAVNPFGRNGYDKSAPVRETSLEPGQSVHLRFRVAIYQGKIDKARLDKDFAEFTKP